MLIRIVTARVKPDRKTEYDKFIDEIAVPMFKKHEGCRSVIVGKDYSDGSGCESVTISLWKDLDSLKRFTGPLYEEAVIFPREKELTQGVPRVQHYDLVERVELSE